MTAGTAFRGLDLPVVQKFLRVLLAALFGERLRIEIEDVLRVANPLFVR